MIVRKSAIAVVVSIVIVIAVVVFLPLKPGEVPPIIQDQPKVEEQAQVNVGTTLKDEPNLADSAVSSNQEEWDFYIDEEGNKNYVISAVDTPDIED